MQNFLRVFGRAIFDSNFRARLIAAAEGDLDTPHQFSNLREILAKDKGLYLIEYIELRRVFAHKDLNDLLDELNRTIDDIFSSNATELALLSSNPSFHQQIALTCFDDEVIQRLVDEDDKGQEMIDIINEFFIDKLGLPNDDIREVIDVLGEQIADYRGKRDEVNRELWIRPGGQITVQFNSCFQSVSPNPTIEGVSREEQQLIKSKMAFSVTFGDDRQEAETAFNTILDELFP